MTLRHLQIFRAICENGCNTTHAAKALHMTQPAVSLALRELEKHYGVTLFDRIGRRLRITEGGRQMLEYASRIGTLFEDMETSMHNWDAMGVVRVGASITIGSQFLPGYVKAFSAQHPGTQVRAVVAPSDELEAMLLDNALDFALIEGVPHARVLLSEAYMEDELIAICPPDGRFTPGQRLSPEAFFALPLLMRERGSGTREVFDRAAAQAGFSPSPVWEAMSTTALVSAVSSGLGVSVLPARMVQGAIDKGQVVPVAVDGLNLRRRFHIVQHQDKYMTASARAFLALCRQDHMDEPVPQYNDLY